MHKNRTKATNNAKGNCWPVLAHSINERMNETNNAIVVSFWFTYGMSVLCVRPCTWLDWLDSASISLVAYTYIYAKTLWFVYLQCLICVECQSKSIRKKSLKKPFYNLIYFYLNIFPIPNSFVCIRPYVWICNNLFRVNYWLFTTFKLSYKKMFRFIGLLLLPLILCFSMVNWFFSYSLLVLSDIEMVWMIVIVKN